MRGQVPTHLLTDDGLATLCGKDVDFPQRTSAAPSVQTKHSPPRGRMVRGFHLLCFALARPPVCGRCLAIHQEGAVT